MTGANFCQYYIDTFGGFASQNFLSASQMVYKLYGLTEEEIEIVEGGSSAQNTSELAQNRLDKAGSV